MNDAKAKAVIDEGYSHLILGDDTLIVLDPAAVRKVEDFAGRARQADDAPGLFGTVPGDDGAPTKNWQGGMDDIARKIERFEGCVIRPGAGGS